MSGEEGKTNDATGGCSQPATLCHLLSGCQRSVPSTWPGLLSTTLPSHPCLHAQILILLLWPCSSRVYTPARKNQEFAPTHDGVMRKRGSRCAFPAKPPAQFQPVGFKKGQSLAEVSDRHSFTWGKTFFVLTAWITYHNRYACRCTSKTVMCPTWTSGNTSIESSNPWKKGCKLFLPEKSIQLRVTAVQKMLQHRALGHTPRRKLTHRWHSQCRRTTNAAEPQLSVPVF